MWRNSCKVLHLSGCHKYRIVTCTPGERTCMIYWVGVDCKTQKAENKQKAFWLSKEAVLEKSVSWNTSDFKKISTNKCKRITIIMKALKCQTLSAMIHVQLWNIIVGRLYKHRLWRLCILLWLLWIFNNHVCTEQVHPSSCINVATSVCRFYLLVSMPYLLNAVVSGKLPFYFSRSRCSEAPCITHKPPRSL